MTDFTAQQLADYKDDGYLIVRNALGDQETRHLRGLVEERARTNGYPASLQSAPAAIRVKGRWDGTR
ncbi:MAG: hypothetical protein GKR89_06930 [Candidatus Latescibacteria bacterium]|nr:hypothetical protein [Candidatus Latescibacterota bacterium]